MTPVSPGQCEVCHYPAAECDAAGSHCAGRTMRELRARGERAEADRDEAQGVAAAYRDAQIRTVAERNAAIERLATAEAELATARDVAYYKRFKAAEAEVARLRVIEDAARSLAGTDEVVVSRLLDRLEDLREALRQTAAKEGET